MPASPKQGFNTESAPIHSTETDTDTCISHNKWKCSQIRSSLEGDNQISKSTALAQLLETCEDSFDRYESAMTASTKKSSKIKPLDLRDAHESFVHAVNSVVTRHKSMRSGPQVQRLPSSHRTYESIMASWGVPKGTEPQCVCGKHSSDMPFWARYKSDLQSAAAQLAVEMAAEQKQNEEESSTTDELPERWDDGLSSDGDDEEEEQR